MNQRDQTSGSSSTAGFWFFIAWFAACLALYFWNIPPHAIQSLRFLVLSFQYSQWTGDQILQIWLSHLSWAVTLLGTLIVFLGSGNILHKRFINKQLSNIEEWAWSLAFGLTLWGLLATGLAFEMLFYINFMKALIVLAALIILLMDRKKAITRCWPPIETCILPRIWKGAAVFIAILSLANLLAPEMSWDAMTYQLILPKFYFFRHGFYPVTGIVPAHYPSLGQMIFSWGLLWGNDSLARAFCFMSHIGTALALAGLGTRFETPKVGWLAAIFYWAFPYLNIFSTRGYVDLFSNFFAVLGLGSLALYFYYSVKKEAAADFKEVHFFGFLGILALGVIWGIKYNAVTFWAAGIILLLGLFIKRQSGAAAWASMILAPAFFLAPWTLKSWVYAQNPIYPYLTRIFQTFDWNDFDQKASAVKFHTEGWQGILKLPKVFWGFFFQNYSSAPNEEVSLVALILLPLVWFGWKRIGWKAPLLVAIGIPFFFWLITSHQLRLISSVIALSSLLLAVGFTQIQQRWPVYARMTNLLFGIYFWILAFYLLQGLIEQPNPFANFLGFQSRYQFLSEILRPEGYMRVANELNQKLPVDAKVLILGQQNGYYLNRVTAYDFDYTYPVLKKMTERATTPEGIYSEFKKNGFTHILYNANSMMGTAVRVDSLGVDRYPWKAEELKNFEQFFLRYTKKIPLPVANGYSFYEITPREGFSVLPDFLPGTEHYYLEKMKETMNLSKLSDMVGKRIPPEAYLDSYAKVAEQHPEIGYPCFQWAFAKLAGQPESAHEVLKEGEEGFRRSGDKASWLTLQADSFIAEEKASKAIPLLLEAEKLCPEREDVARNLTAAYYNEHDLKNASLEADRAVALAPFSEEYQQIAGRLKAALSTTR